MTSFTVDGVEWPVSCKFVRTVELKESDISGLMMDYSYNRDPVGTWLQYDLAIVCPNGMEREYNQLHDILAQPVDGHSFIMPYDADTITITARVTNLRDTLYEGANGNYWAGTEVTILSNHPIAVMSLGEMLTRGRSPLPELNAGEIGDTWTYTSSGWVHGHYDDADTMYF